MTRWKREFRRFLANPQGDEEPNEFQRARIDDRYGRIANDAAVGFQFLENARWHRVRYTRAWTYAALGYADAESDTRYALASAKDALLGARKAPPAPLP